MVNISKRAGRARHHTDDWRSSIGYLVRHVTRLLSRYTDERLADYGITLKQYFVLRVLWGMHEPTQRELAAALSTPESHLALMLDGLQRTGLVKRRKSVTDRRKSHVIVTPAGERLRRVLIDPRDGVFPPMLDEILTGIPDRDIDRLRAALSQMAANLEQLCSPTSHARLQHYSQEV